LNQQHFLNISDVKTNIKKNIPATNNSSAGSGYIKYNKPLKPCPLPK
jgi:hypothetical protein